MTSTEKQNIDKKLRMFVVDVLRHDIEPLSSILKMLNNTGLSDGGSSGQKQD